jgi:hypothetical protein
VFEAVNLRIRILGQSAGIAFPGEDPQTVAPRVEALPASRALPFAQRYERGKKEHRLAETKNAKSDPIGIAEKYGGWQNQP